MQLSSTEQSRTMRGQVIGCHFLRRFSAGSFPVERLPVNRRHVLYGDNENEPKKAVLKSFMEHKFQ
jgi:hypothetical protein